MRSGIIERFSGVYPALMTPFDEKDRVNEDVVRAMVDRHLAAGMRGFFVCGSAGEGLAMRTAERKRLAEVVIDQVQGRGLVIVHVGAIPSVVSAELAAHAESVGADAVSSVPPIYYNAGLEGIVRHYQTIAAATTLPIVAYNIPATTGITMTLPVMAELFKIENVIGMKFTYYNYYEMRNIIEMMDEQCLILSGSDEMFLPALVMGANGAIGSTQNIAPELFVEIYQAFLEGDLDRARALQYRANRMVLALLTCGGVRAWKAVLSRQGFAMGGCRPPLTNVTGEQETALLKSLEGMGLF